MNSTDVSRTFVDLSQTLNDRTPVYPGDPGVEITVLDKAQEPTESNERRLNNSRLAVGAHNGTHIDAPFHFFSSLPTIDQIPIERCCGAAICLDLSHSQIPGVIDAVDLGALQSFPEAAKCLLLYTRWSERWQEPDYFTAHPVLTEAAARTIVEAGIRLLGVDFPSVDRPPFPAHVVLLRSQVLIVENLTNLDQLVNRAVDFFAVPLPIEGRDASPVRAFAVLR